MKFFRKLYFFLLYLLPAVLFFSYYPLIKLGGNATMNFELSLPMIFLVIFDIVAFLLLISVARRDKILSRPSATNGERGNSLRHFSEPSREEQAATTERGPRKDGRPNGAKKSRWRLLPGISNRKFFLFALFPLYATLSIFWSANPTRAILTAGVLWLVFFAAFATLYLTPLLAPPPRFRRRLIAIFFISSAIICLFCWIQCLLDVLNVPRDITLLCPGCTYRTFGFPHPSGFAIEPQFMGNLLLAPTLLSLYLLTTRLEKRQALVYLALAFLFSATLFLTFSRGAIYAFAVALVILLIFSLARHHFRLSLVIIPVVAFAFTLVAQGTFSVISPVHDSFCSGVTKSIHQLSLGIIDLRGLCPVTPAQASIIQQTAFEQAIPEAIAADKVLSLVENSVENSQPAPVTPPVAVDNSSSQFGGYIPESTNTRLGLNSVAFQTWLSSPYYIFFGVGLGGAGVALSEHFPDNPYAVPDAIVQNEPISLLLELGLVGIALIVLAFVLAFVPGRYLKSLRLTPAETAPDAPSFWRLPALPFMISLIVAYFITLNFFSGLPNALQIYLLPPLFYYLFKKGL